MPNQDALAQEIERLTDAEFLYQHSPCGYVSFNAEGQILRINKTFCQWLGLAQEDNAQRTFAALLDNAAALFYQMVVMPMLHREEEANEINMKFGQGEHNFDGLFNAVAHKDAQGALLVVNATVHKITNRKKYESDLLQAKKEALQGKKKFEFLSNSIPNLIWTALPSGEVNFINQRLQDYFQQDDLSWYSNLMGFPEAERAVVQKAWNHSMQTGAILDLEATMVNQNGDPEWFLLRMEPFLNEHGLIELWIGSATTIHKNKVQQLAAQSKLTKNLHTAHQTISNNKGLFSRIAFNQSHMIRKPLANIMGLIPLLQEELLSEEGFFVLKCMVESTEELDVLIKKVVDQTTSI